MSVQAISWALAQHGLRSTEKFVLVCMSNYADENGHCYPSIAALSDDTAQDRKTVLANMKSLSAAGLIEDTGRRVGATKQVIVYKVHFKSPKDPKEVLDGSYGKNCFYSYRLENPENGQFYVGIRTFIGQPAQDDYMGSGRWPSMCKRSGIKLSKSIIKEYRTWEEARQDEQHLIDEALQSTLCMNSPKTGTGPKIGTVQTVPKTDGNSTVFGRKQYRKRDTDPKGHVSTRKSAARTAFRLPDDFELTQERRLVAEAERLPADRTFSKFVDYWKAASGAKARKLDWDATWRNWCKNEADRKGSSPAKPPASPYRGAI